MSCHQHDLPSSQVSLARHLRHKMVDSHSQRNSDSSMHEITTLQTLPSLLRGFGKKPALVAFTKDRTGEWTYAKLADQATRLAAGLIKAGIEKGDHIALVAENRPEWMTACLGILA